MYYIGNTHTCNCCVLAYTEEGSGALTGSHKRGKAMFILKHPRTREGVVLFWKLLLFCLCGGKQSKREEEVPR